MATRFVICLLFHLGRDFSTDYANRFLIKKWLWNSQSQSKIGANDSELACATFLKKSDSGKIFKIIVFSQWFLKNSRLGDFSKVCSECVLWGFRFPETGFRKPVSGHRFPDTGFRKPVSGNRFPEIGFRKPVSGNWFPETGFRKFVSGHRFPETGFRKPTSRLTWF